MILYLSHFFLEVGKKNKQKQNTILLQYPVLPLARPPTPRSHGIPGAIFLPLEHASPAQVVYF